MPAQALVAEPDNFFSNDTFKALAMTALSQFGRMPATVHYYAVESLRRRMMALTRAHIQSELAYWREALRILHGRQAINYSSFDIFNMLQVVRMPLNEVARHGNKCAQPTLTKAQNVCAVLSRT